MVPKWPFLFPKGHHWEIGCWQGSISQCARNTYQRASRKVIFRIRSLQYIAWIPTHVGVNTSTTLLGWTRQIVSILEAMIFIRPLQVGDSHLPMSLMVHPSSESAATSRKLGPVSESGEISWLQLTSRQPHELHGTPYPLQAKVHFLDVWIFGLWDGLNFGQTVGPCRTQRHLSTNFGDVSQHHFCPVNRIGKGHALSLQCHLGRLCGPLSRQGWYRMV